MAKERKAVAIPVVSIEVWYQSKSGSRSLVDTLKMRWEAIPEEGGIHIIDKDTVKDFAKALNDCAWKFTKNWETRPEAVWFSLDFRAPSGLSVSVPPRPVVLNKPWLDNVVMLRLQQIILGHMISGYNSRD